MAKKTAPRKTATAKATAKVARVKAPKPTPEAPALPAPEAPPPARFRPVRLRALAAFSAREVDPDAAPGHRIRAGDTFTVRDAARHAALLEAGKAEPTR
jgi:hypothetical protein